MSEDFGMGKIDYKKYRWIFFILVCLASLYAIATFFGVEKPAIKRNVTLLEMDSSGIYEIDFHNPDNFFRITKDITETWKLNDTLPVNQEKVEQYITQFEKISSKNYITPNNINALQNDKTHSMIIKSADEPIDVQISCYKVNQKDYDFILISNQNSNIVFTSSKNELIKQLFWKAQQFH